MQKERLNNILKDVSTSAFMVNEISLSSGELTYSISTLIPPLRLDAKFCLDTEAIGKQESYVSNPAFKSFEATCNVENETITIEEDNHVAKTAIMLIGIRAGLANPKNMKG